MAAGGGYRIIALLSIGGALALGEYVTAGVIAVMLSGGRALEDFAEARARREMSALLARVPRTASRYEDGQITTVPLDSVAPGDRLLVRGRGMRCPWTGSCENKPQSWTSRP